MAKFFNLLTDGLTPYLDLVIDNDWKNEGSPMVIRETDSKGNTLPDTPDERKWQFRRGFERFWAGDALRAAGHDTQYEDSRRLWRKGWIAGCRQLIEEKGGKWP